MPSVTEVSLLFAFSPADKQVIIECAAMLSVSDSEDIRPLICQDLWKRPGMNP